MTMRMIRKLVPLLVLLVILSGCGATAPEQPAPTAAPTALPLRAAVFDPPRKLEDFSIMSTTGEPFTLSEHRGEVSLIYFGYRSCPDFCPTTFAEMKLVYDALEQPADKLNIIFVTIDPERDTLDLLTAYTRNFNPDFIGLRAEGAALTALQSQFGVVAEKRIVGESAMSYLFDHTASLFLVGPDGTLAGQYLYGTDYRDIVRDLQQIFATL